MRQKNKYKKLIIEHYVKAYIEENGMVPSQTEINQFLISFTKKSPDLLTYGLSEQLTEKYSFLEVSSASKANKNFTSFKYDLKYQDESLVDFIKTLDISKYNLKSYLTRTSDSLSKLEARLNSLIINYSNSDIFLHSVEENFKSHDKVDLKESTASCFKGYCTLDGRASYYDLSSCSVKYDFRTKNKKLSSGTNVELKKILENNGSECTIEFVTTQRVGRVSLEVTLDFNESEGLYVGSSIISGSAIENNSKVYYGTEVEVFTKSFRAITPRVKRFSSGENFTSINEPKVKKMRFTFMKEAADREVGDGVYVYVFNISKLKIRKDSIEKNYGELLCGPYDVISDSGEPISFSMAKLSTDTCCIVPGKTSVNFFLSVDQDNWIPASYGKDSQNVIKFNSLDLTESGETIDPLLFPGEILEDNGDYYYNYRIKSDLLVGVNKNNIRIKRNIPQGFKIYGSNRGWYFNPASETYSCSVEITDLEGKYLDIGPNTIKVNGFIKSGLIKLSQGFYSFEVDSETFFEAESGLASEVSLAESDPFYPYNVKSLIEGYVYPANFDGEKVYQGLGQIYSFLLNYIPSEKFDIFNDLNGYTIFEKEHEGELYSYFRVNVMLSDSSWRKEISSLKITGSSKQNNKLYVKAIIRSSEPGRVPHINSFNVRVI